MYAIESRELTLNYSEKNNNYKEKKCDIKNDSVKLHAISHGRLQLVTYATTGSYTNIQVKFEALLFGKQNRFVLV